MNSLKTKKALFRIENAMDAQRELESEEQKAVLKEKHEREKLLMEWQEEKHQEKRKEEGPWKVC